MDASDFDATVWPRLAAIGERLWSSVDDVDAARTLGALLKKHGIRDAHVNVIPLNPTKGYGGKRAKNGAVDRFCKTLETEFGVSATPRVRRGIDIDAGCGQLTTSVLEDASEDAAS